MRFWEIFSKKLNKHKNLIWKTKNILEEGKQIQHVFGLGLGRYPLGPILKDGLSQSLGVHLKT